jgi:hypothetical protein
MTAEIPLTRFSPRIVLLTLFLLSVTALGRTFTSPALSADVSGAQIFSVSPTEGHQGQTMNVVLNGSGFVPGAAVSFGADINVNSAQVSSIALDHILTANITINASAELGLRDITVTSPGDKPVVEPDAFEVLGTAPGRLVVTPKKLVFPKTKVGKFKTKKLKIKNTGDGDLNGTITPPAKGSGFVMNPQQTSYSLNPGETLILNVEFHPTKQGKAKGEIVIASNDPNKPSVTVPLKGKGK